MAWKLEIHSNSEQKFSLVSDFENILWNHPTLRRRRTALKIIRDLLMMYLPATPDTAPHTIAPMPTNSMLIVICIYALVYLLSANQPLNIRKGISIPPATVSRVATNFLLTSAMESRKRTDKFRYPYHLTCRILNFFIKTDKFCHLFKIT